MRHDMALPYHCHTVYRSPKTITRSLGDDLIPKGTVLYDFQQQLMRRFH